MENPAPQSKKSEKIQVLVTDVDSYLGRELAKSLLSVGCVVYGMGKLQTNPNLLSNKDFTLTDLDLNQPLPSHLPKFDSVFFLEREKNQHISKEQLFYPILENLSAQLKNQKSKVYILAPLESRTVYSNLIKHDKFKLFLIGDLYGPKMPLFEKALPNLISQAVKNDKIVLSGEGLSLIYPAYITDVIFAINKFTFTKAIKHFQVIFSESPKTQLSIAYQIQKTARLTLGKELGIYFERSENHLSIHHSLNPAGPLSKFSEVNFSPKIQLEKGLKNTLDSFKSSVTSTSPAETSSPALLSKIDLNQPTESKITKKTSKISLPKIPKDRFLSKKKLFVISLALAALFIFKTGLDLYLGLSRLNNSKEALLAGDFKKAQKTSLKAASSLKSANREVSIILYPASFVFPKQKQSLNSLLESAQSTSASLSYLSSGVDVLSKNLHFIISQQTQNKIPDLELSKGDLNRAYFESAKALNLAKKSNLWLLQAKIEKARSEIHTLNKISASVYELSNLLNEITGSGRPKTYLMLLTNSTELRPGGGFIGNIGLIEFENSRLKKISVEDVYTFDGQLQETIEPPKELTEKLGVEKFYLRDSNWSPDFALNSANARDFFKKETGKNVDGVISLDIEFLQKVLEKTGPIKLSDYSEEITAQNLFDKGEYYSEVGFFPGSTQKKDFFGALSRALIERTVNSLASSSKESSLSLVSLIEVARDALSQKHLMLTFDSPSLSAYISTHGWNNVLPPQGFDPAENLGQTTDFLSISEANVGANKVNRYLERKVFYEMTIGRDADLVANLKIIYKNNSLAETWPGGTYVNFLRIYTPPAVSLLEFNGVGPVDPQAVEVSSQDNLSVISTYVEVPIKSTKEITFKYRIPKNIKLETGPAYHLYVQKQPGTGADPFELTFNLPAYLALKSANGNTAEAGKQSINLKSNLQTDLSFEVEVAKK